MSEYESRDELMARYLEGDLPDPDRVAFEARLASEAELAAEVEAYRGLMAEAAALPREMTPPRDLWVGIEAQLAPRGNELESHRAARQGHPRAWLGPLLAVAAAAVFLLAGFYWAEDLADPPVGEVESALQQFGEAEAAYVKARDELLAAIEHQSDDIDPATLATVEQTMAVIDGAVGEIRAALADDPNNGFLIETLMATRQKELDFLRQIARAPWEG